MADIEHSDLGGNANQHALHRWAHADQAARFAQAVAATDVGKVSKQASNSTYWVLVDHAQVGSAAGWKELTDTGPLAASYKFLQSWGHVAAPAVAAARFFPRTGITFASAAATGEYPAPKTGTFTFTLTARVGGTKLTTDTVACEIYKNGVATGITFTLLTTDTVKQASGSLAVIAGDGISVRVLQSATEAQAAWNCSVNVSAE
jgi:hypothetical protein